MVIGCLRARLLIRGANSLKDKRRVLKPLIHRLRTGHNCAVAEVDDHDVWRSAVIAVVTVFQSRDTAERLLATISRDLASDGDFDLVEEQLEFL